MIQQQQQKTSQWVLTSVQFNLVNVLKRFKGGETFILDDFTVTSSIFNETRNGGKRFGQKGGIRLQKSSNLPTKNNMT